LQSSSGLTRWEVSFVGFEHHRMSKWSCLLI
jgi:hypothetical protein